MKTKKFRKKLDLRKFTISNLKMSNIIAGDSETYAIPCDTAATTSFKCWTETAGTNSPWCESFYVTECCTWLLIAK